MAAKVFDFNSRKIQTRECHYARCNKCRHEWVAPTIGNCPRCHATDTKRLKRRRFDYVRS
jgi:hypothetical protein